MWSLDFAEIQALQREGDWDGPATLLAAHARSVEAAGAELLVLCTNTMHRVAPAIADAISIPLLHIADATADAVAAAGLERVGLLGDRATRWRPDFLVERHRRARDRGARTAAAATATSFTR